MNGPNPYEAPRHLEPPRPGRKRTPTSVGCVSSALGGAGGIILGASAANGPGMRNLVPVCGLIGAIAAGVAGHFAGRALFDPPDDPDETEAEARRRKTLDEIAVAEALRTRAEKDGDEDVVRKLAEYQARLERKLRA